MEYVKKTATAAYAKVSGKKTGSREITYNPNAELLAQQASRKAKKQELDNIALERKQQLEALRKYKSLFNEIKSDYPSDVQKFKTNFKGNFDTTTCVTNVKNYLIKKSERNRTDVGDIVSKIVSEIVDIVTEIENLIVVINNENIETQLISSLLHELDKEKIMLENLTSILQHCETVIVNEPLLSRVASKASSRIRGTTISVRDNTPHSIIINRKVKRATRLLEKLGGKKTRRQKHRKNRTRKN